MRPGTVRLGNFRSGPGRGEGGFALALTIWVLAALSIVAGEFLLSSRLRVKADSHIKDEVQAYGLALAGYQAALDLLRGKVAGLSRSDEGELLLHESQGGEGSPAAQDEVPFGDGAYSFEIDDEDGKFDINRQDRRNITALLGEAGMETGVERDTIADSILDWRDRNREHHINGAEEDYYQDLERPYSAKDGPIEVKEELLLVRGMKEEYFYGGESEEGSFAPLERLVTVYPVVFNAGTAPEEVLRVMKRARPARGLRVSQYYTVTATGVVSGGRVRKSIRAVVRREAQGGKITFQLLYWNDSYSPRKSEDAVG